MADDSETTKDAQPAADVPSMERPSPSGMRAIQGLTAPPLEPDAQCEAVRRVAPDEEFTPPRTLNAKEANDLELATQRAEAAKATRYHNERDTSRQAEYQRLRSEIAEDVAVQSITGGVQADAFSRAETNFPNYDVLAPGEASSVKVYSLKEGQPRLDQYRDDFAQLVDPESGGNRAAAERLMRVRAEQPETWEQLGPHLPEGVRSAETPEGMQAALVEKATLRIPSDQVEAVRADLRRDMSTRPQKYGLDPDLPPGLRAEAIDRTVETKVLSIDDRYTTGHYQAKAAERVGLRSLQMQRRFPDIGN